MKKGEISSLTGLRAFAALWVGIHHTKSSLEGIRETGFVLLDRLFTKGWLGVDLFFVLSGFILAHSYHHKFRDLSLRAHWDFLSRRFARIYPAHIFTLGLFVLAVGLARSMGAFPDPENRYSLTSLLSQVFLVHGIGLFEPVGWNLPSWSISSEVLAYMIFPVLLLSTMRCASLIGSSSMIIGILLTAIVMALFLNDGKKFMLSFEYTWFRILSEFTLGLLLYNITRVRESGIIYFPIAALSLAGIFLQGLVVSSLFDFMYILYFMSLIHSLALLPPSKEWAWAQRAGEISYSFYLLHPLVIMMLNQFIRRSRWLMENPIVSIALFITITSIAAWLVYTWIETPARKFIISRSERRGPMMRSSYVCTHEASAPSE